MKNPNCGVAIFEGIGSSLPPRRSVPPGVNPFFNRMRHAAPNFRLFLSMLPAVGAVLLMDSVAPESVRGDSGPALRWYEAGFRGGSSLSRSNDFRQYELFAALATPYEWANRSDTLRARLELQTDAGVLRGNGVTEGIVSAGPAIDFSSSAAPVALTLGVAPTYLTGRRFGETDFGQRFQFTSSAAFTWMITPDIGLRYRIQHMSNARMAAPNPGLDTHSAGIVVAF